MRARFFYFLTFLGWLITNDAQAANIKPFSECTALTRKLASANEALRASRPAEAIPYLLDILHSRTEFQISVSEYADLHLQIAEAYNAVKKYEEAIPFLEHLIARFAESENPAEHSYRIVLSRAHYLLAESFVGLEKFADAETHFTISKKYRPEDASIDVRLGNFYGEWAQKIEAQGQSSAIYLEHALESYERALKNASPSQHNLFLEAVSHTREKLVAKKSERNLENPVRLISEDSPERQERLAKNTELNQLISQTEAYLLTFKDRENRSLKNLKEILSLLSNPLLPKTQKLKEVQNQLRRWRDQLSIADQQSLTRLSEEEIYLEKVFDRDWVEPMLDLTQIIKLDSPLNFKIRQIQFRFESLLDTAQLVSLGVGKNHIGAHPEKSDKMMLDLQNSLENLKSESLFEAEAIANLKAYLLEKVRQEREKLLQGVGN